MQRCCGKRLLSSRRCTLPKRNAKASPKSQCRTGLRGDVPFKNPAISRKFFRTREWRNGRRAGLRIQCRKACGFKSRLSQSHKIKEFWTIYGYRAAVGEDGVWLFCACAGILAQRPSDHEAEPSLER